MKTFALAVGLVFCAAAARAADKIDLVGKYTVVSGKNGGKDIDEKAKKVKYTATADAFYIDDGNRANFVASMEALKIVLGVEFKVEYPGFVIGYKLKPGTTPAEIDMAVAEGPEGTKGSIALGIVEVKGDTIKLAYSLNKEKRPKDFEGKTDFLIELKKIK